MAMLHDIEIDGKVYGVDENLALIQACEQVGVEIPRFCYHERLSIAGNCRMCLVELVGAPKPAASCHVQVNDMRGGKNGEPPQVRTNSAIVKKAREGVMEFLLINHPLDCPICDQGGECDLQDQAMAYGLDASRYDEHKRAQEDVYLGPLIGTHMNRCIQCTRCVRFITEVAGVPEMGATGRGEDAEIVSYISQALTSELQGNIIDLCPVGALTSKPYAFNARPWELKKTQSIDVMDALGSSIRIDTRGRAVMRIMPREHADVNEEWLSDKSRFVWDGLSRQRLDQPYIRENGKLKPATWNEAFTKISNEIKKTTPEKVAAIAGDMVSVEAMWTLKKLLESFGSYQYDCRQDGAKLPQNNRAAWLFNATVSGIDDADAIFIIGSNPRVENPVLNARIRKAWLNGAEIGLIGEQVDLTYDYDHLGTAPNHIRLLEESTFGKVMKGAKNPLIILGNGAITRDDGAALLNFVMKQAQQFRAKFCFLHTAASRVGGMEIGFTPPSAFELSNMDVVYLLGADEIDTVALADKFVIYQGSHGDTGAHCADIVLPAGAYTEQSGLFVNLEGRPQLAHRASFPPGQAREDWAIIRALSDHLGRALTYRTLEDVRAEIFTTFPHLAEIDRIKPAILEFERVDSFTHAPFVSGVKDFYLTNPIARASKVMAELSKQSQDRLNPKTKMAV